MILSTNDIINIVINVKNINNNIPIFFDKLEELFLEYLLFCWFLGLLVLTVFAISYNIYVLKYSKK